MVGSGGTGRKEREIIKKIEKKQHLYQAFSKRRNGLFKKIKKLCNSVPNVNAAAVTFSPFGRPCSSGNPDVSSVIQRYFIENYRIKENNIQESANNDQENLNNVQESVSNLIGNSYREKGVNNVQENLSNNQENGGNGDFWWERSLEEMDLNEVMEFRDKLLKFKENLISRIESLERAKRDVSNDQFS